MVTTSNIVSSLMPEVQEIRKRIDGLRSYPHRYALQFQYLTGSRVSEVCGKYAVSGKDFTIQKYKDDLAVIFTVKTAKREGRERDIAIPLGSKYESWSSDLADYFEKYKHRKKMFNFSTRTLQNYGKKLFKNMEYTIEKYVLKGRTYGFHKRNICTHGLRHVRATELLTVYGFDMLDLTIFMGWTLKTGVKTAPQVIDRYIYKQWVRYFPKLLKLR